jgi:gas vesicle protein
MKGNVLLGILAGVAAGAMLGVLLAPDKGSETRKKLTKKGDDYLEDLRENLDNLKSKYEDLMERMTEKYEAMKTSGSMNENGGGTQARRV